ncbi:MAG: translation initiation factor IF-3, partial [bacterium]
MSFRSDDSFHDRQSDRGGSGGAGADKGMRVNEQIRISPVRVIAADGSMMGAMPVNRALELAREAGLDLVEVAANERPPVCKIMD